MPSEEPALLRDNDRVRITFRAGDCAEAVVSFAGIGLALGGVQREEFRNSLSGERDVYFVIDKRRRWYNDIYDEVLDVLRERMSRRPPRRTLCLGNSMGGTGAVIFAGELPRCSTALAFCPQSSANLALVPFDYRSPQYKGAITQWRVPDAVPLLAPHVRYHLYYGSGDLLDLRHARRFLRGRGAQLTVRLVRGCGHDVARHLKAKGVAMAALIDAALRHDDASHAMAGVPFTELHGRSRLDAWRLEGHIARLRLAARLNRRPG